MAEFADSFLYSDAWELFQMVTIMAGMASVLALIFGVDENSRRAKVLVWSGMGLLLLAISSSMLLEEILPAWPSIADTRRLPYALSFGGFMLFIVMFVLSARRLVQDGLFSRFPLLFKAGPERAEAMTAMRPGVLWFCASAAVFAVSLLGYHGLDVIMDRGG